MSATGRAASKKTQYTLRFTPDEVATMDALKDKNRINSNNELFIFLMNGYDKMMKKAELEEKEKNRFKEELVDLKLKSQEYISSFQSFKTAAAKEIKNLDLNKYNRW